MKRRPANPGGRRSGHRARKKKKRIEDKEQLSSTPFPPKYVKPRDNLLYLLLTRQATRNILKKNVILLQSPCTVFRFLHLPHSLGQKFAAPLDFQGFQKRRKLMRERTERSRARDPRCCGSVDSRRTEQHRTAAGMSVGKPERERKTATRLKEKDRRERLHRYVRQRRDVGSPSIRPSVRPTGPRYAPRHVFS